MTDADDEDRDESPPEREDLSLSTRKRLFEHVEANPGIHFRQLARDLDMETGLLQYHLDELEEYGVLDSEEHGGKRRLFVSRKLDAEERAILAVLRHETTRQLVLYLLEDGPARNGEIADAVGVTPPTVSWHLSNLVEKGVVEEVEEGRTTIYRVTDEELTVQLLARYRESFADGAVDRIVDSRG